MLTDLVTVGKRTYELCESCAAALQIHARHSGQTYTRVGGAGTMRTCESCCDMWGWKQGQAEVIKPAPGVGVL